MHHRHHGRGHGPRVLFRGGMKAATGTGSCRSSDRAVRRKSRTCPRDLAEHELLERLENHQRDLEQQLADIADVITHLRDRDEGTQPQQV
jgi:hypothetical protein